MNSNRIFEISYIIIFELKTFTKDWFIIYFISNLVYSEFKYYLDVIDSTQISVNLNKFFYNLFRNAGDNSRFPKSPPGFIVATITKPSFAFISSAFFPPFSGNVKVFSASSTEFNLSKTLSSAKEISSIKKSMPYSIAYTLYY